MSEFEIDNRIRDLQDELDELYRSREKQHFDSMLDDRESQRNWYWWQLKFKDDRIKDLISQIDFYREKLLKGAKE